MNARITRVAAIVAAAATLALPLVACVPSSVTTTTGHTITVGASAAVKVTPDVARISVAIVTTGDGPAAAQKANAKPTNAVIAYLKEQGVDKKDIQTSYTDLSPVWDEHGKTDTYEMRTVLSVSGLAIEDVSVVMEGCVDAGATEIMGPQYYASGYDEAYQEALTQAIEASRPKAEAIAEASDVVLGKVVSVTEGYQDNSIAYNKGMGATAEAASDAVADIEPGELDVEAQVTVSYAIR